MNLKSDIGNALKSALQNSKYFNGNVNLTNNIIGNKKYLDFQDAGVRRKEAIIKNSAEYENMFLSGNANPLFNDFANQNSLGMSNIAESSKTTRLYEYRVMANYPEVEQAIKQISSSFLTEDEEHRFIKFDYLDKNYNYNDYKRIKDEFDNFILNINLKQNCEKWVRDFLVDGEIFIELIICNKTKEDLKRGILGCRQLQTESMTVEWLDQLNGIINCFYGTRKIDAKQPDIISKTFTSNNISNMDVIKYNTNQIIYIANDRRDPTNEFVVPFIEQARKRYIQLSYLEDSIVIYRLVRSPSRLVFKVDTRNLSAVDAEHYLKRVRDNYWNTRQFDISRGDFTNKFNPQAMIDGFWIAKNDSNSGIEISELGGNVTFGQIEDLEFFLKALYRSLQIPVSRLQSDSQTNVDASTILQEELNFAKLIIGFQYKFAEALKQAFITHLSLKGIYKELNIKENYIDLTFNPPSHYFMMRKAQEIKIKSEAFNQAISTNCISLTYAMKKYLGMSDDEILNQYEFRKIEAAQEWNIDQIKSNGPNWAKDTIQEISGEPPEQGGDFPDFGREDDFEPLSFDSESEEPPFEPESEPTSGSDEG